MRHLNYIIRGTDGERRLAAHDFPVILGSTDSANILIAGLDRNVEAAVITLDKGYPFLQPAGSYIPVLHNGTKLGSPVRLNHGDVIRIGLSEIVFRLQGKDCIFHVAEPGGTGQAAPPQPTHVPGTPEKIEPVSFRSRQPSSKLRPLRALKWCAGFFLGVILILLGVSTWFVFTARQVEITIAPVPESISVSGSILTPRFGNYYLMRPGEYTIEAFRECFSGLEHTFRVSNEKRQNVLLNMQKLPGRLVINAHQSGVNENRIEGARVYIDGTEVGETPLENIEIMPGPRRLEVRSSNYQDSQTDIEVQGCGKLQEFKMSLLPGWSDVTIRSMPPNADVRIDGSSIGKTPLDVQLAAGTYMLLISADRHKTWKHRLIVRPNEPQEIKDVQLEPADGTLAIKTKPAGANVIIGEAFIGQTPLSIGLSPDKDHVVQISKTGYEKTTSSVRVSSGASEQLHVNLKAREGILHLLVEPSDSELLVDGKSWGPAPEQLRMIAVEHTLEFKKEGYLPYGTRITPRPGFPQHVKIVLKKERVADDTPPGEITTRSGYSLTLIRPKPYTMGSSRREQGHRSNETLRKVKLTRPFYMGMRVITNKEFREFMARHNSGTFQSRNLNSGDQPVVRVTWEQAALFSNWLSAQESLPPAYVKKGEKMVAVEPLNTGYRLPTEAEWEYCARFTNQQTPLKYPWGSEFPPGELSGNYADQSAKDLLPTVLEGYNDGYVVTSPPATFKPNGLGLYDLGGNVAEWSHDYYSMYSYAPEKTYVDPVGPKEGKHHLIRGSGWKHGSISTLRLAYRSYSDDKREDTGFRVCRYVK